MNVTSELVKKIQSTTNSEMGNSANSTELRKSMNDIMGKLEQKENVIIKKKIKKSDILNNLSKKTPKMDKPIGKLYSMGKSETKEVTGSGSAGGYSAPLFTTNKKDMTEKWSQKYKDSIDCDNPKGFSQKAHCQGKSKKGEFKEATGVASSGSYVTPAAWAKSTSKKDWRGKSKTQIPGGKFVTVKKKCKKFPYCNQGDINALKLTNEEIVDNSIKKLSKKYNISEEIIKKLIMDDYHKIK
jgi:hypothetical protein